MQPSRLLMAGVVTGAVALTAVIYLLPKNQPAEVKSAKPAITVVAGFDLKEYTEHAVAGLDQNFGSRYKELKASEKEAGEQPAVMSAFWDSAGVPGVAASYYEQVAGTNNNEESYLNAAYRYFDAFKSSHDSAESAYFSSKAINSYSKVLEINPNNLNAKTDLGALYAEATGEPMKGIMMLREVVAADPNHENAQLNLGFLSMRSGQFEKALERFDKVLAINPARIDMYIYRGEAMVQLGRKKEAIESFKIFRNLTSDKDMIANVDQYIATLEGTGVPEKKN